MLYLWFIIVANEHFKWINCFLFVIKHFHACGNRTKNLINSVSLSGSDFISWSHIEVLILSSFTFLLIFVYKHFNDIYRCFKTLPVDTIIFLLKKEERQMNIRFWELFTLDLKNKIVNA